MEIPLTGDARSEFRIVLGGQSVRITVWWQPSDGHWYFSLAWVDGRPIVSGVRIVRTSNLLIGHVSDFRGRLHVLGEGDPGRDAWGRTHRLLYIE